MDATSLPPTDALANSLKLTGSRCLCRACGEHFNSVGLFDRHRVRGECLTVEQMTARGWSLNPAGFWIARPRPENRAIRATQPRFSRLRSAGDHGAGAQA